MQLGKYRMDDAYAATASALSTHCAAADVVTVEHKGLLTTLKQMLRWSTTKGSTSIQL